MSFSSPPPPRDQPVRRSEQTSDASRRISAALLTHAESVAREPGLDREREPDVPREIPLADVQHSVERFASQAEALDRRGMPTPVLFSREGPVAPVDIGLPSLHRERRGYLDDDFPEPLVSILFEISLSRAYGAGAVELLDRGQSHELVERRLGEFIAARIDNSVSRSDGSGPGLAYATPGYPFTVTTSTPERRIHYSPAYFINTNLVFGGSLSTVTGHLNPGRYTFGAYSMVDGNNLWDGAEYDVPHTTSSAHIGF